MGHMIVSFEAEIDRAAGHTGYVAANVMTEQVMREEEIARKLSAKVHDFLKQSCTFAESLQIIYQRRPINASSRRITETSPTLLTQLNAARASCSKASRLSPSLVRT